MAHDRRTTQRGGRRAAEKLLRLRDKLMVEMPRTFERDLEAASTRPVKERVAPQEPDGAPGMDEVLSERYTGRTR